MARKIEIQFEQETFIGGTAPARDQVEMLQIASRSGLLPAMSATVTTMGLAASMAAVDSASFNRLKSLCLIKGNIVRQVDDVPVAENMFQDQAHNFLVLVGKVLKENIGPFWQLSSGESKKTSEINAKDVQK